MFAEKERARIRELARQMAEEAHSARQKDRVARYQSINGLQNARPTVAVYPPPKAIADMNPQSLLETTDPLLRQIEQSFLTELNEAQNWKTDHPVTDVFYTGLFYQVTPWMGSIREVRIKEDGTGSEFEPCINDWSDLEKLRQPQLIVDHRATEERFELLSDLMGDILDLRRGKHYEGTCGWGDAMIDQLAEMRGLEQLYYDMYDEPECVHEAMRRMTEGKLNLFRQFEQEGILNLNNGSQRIGSCSYPLSRELPPPGFDPSHVRPRDLWVFSHAQEFTNVSPDMLEEFVLPYQAQITNLFGLCSYGCCEPMDRQVGLLAKYIKNLRILSMSPFSDYEMVASEHRGRFVMAYKLHPQLFMNFDPQKMECAVREILEKSRGCPLTLNGAEITYYDGRPDVFLEAAEVIQRTIDRYWVP